MTSDVNLRQGKVLNLKAFFPGPKDIEEKRKFIPREVIENFRQHLRSEMWTQYDDNGVISLDLTGEGKAVACLVLQEVREAGWDVSWQARIDTETGMSMNRLVLSQKKRGN